MPQLMFMLFEDLSFRLFCLRFHYCFCTLPGATVGGSQKGGFLKGWFWRMFPGTKTGTRVHSDVLPERELERGYVRMLPWNDNCGDSFCDPNPHIQGKNMDKHLAPKLPNLPCFEAFGAIFCPDVCSYFCLVCGGRGSPAYF